MDFGIFLGPWHRAGQDPTLALERDLELIERLDQLGYHEAWIGEHHSAGWEIVGSPEIFIMAAAGRTRSIRLGTGVVLLPYHHPLMVADRMVLLDHLTRADNQPVFGGAMMNAIGKAITDHHAEKKAHAGTTAGSG